MSKYLYIENIFLYMLAGRYFLNPENYAQFKLQLGRHLDFKLNCTLNASSLEFGQKDSDADTTQYDHRYLHKSVK